MELWIRSQDKTTLIKSYEIYITEHSKDSYLIRAKRTSHILGSYNSFERALEVLDEIQNILKPKVLVNTYKVEQAQLCDGTQFIKPMLDDIQVQNVTSYVYEIPKD